MVRLVATDLDGTLLPPSGVLSARTRRALAAVVAAGLDLVIVTARPPRFLDPIADELGLAGVALCANGAIEYDLGQRRVLRVRALAPAAAERVGAAVAAACPGVGFALETGDYVLHEPAFARPAHGDRRVPVASLAQLWTRTEPIVKLLAWSAAHDADTLLAAALLAADGVECTHSGGLGLIEVSAAGVTKQAALAELCARRGIPAAEVIAFGDMPNDLGMLHWAGTGYAVATAHPTVRAAPGLLPAPAPADDGVAQILEPLLPPSSPFPSSPRS